MLSEVLDVRVTVAALVTELLVECVHEAVMLTPVSNAPVAGPATITKLPSGRVTEAALVTEPCCGRVEGSNGTLRQKMLVIGWSKRKIFVSMTSLKN